MISAIRGGGDVTDGRKDSPFWDQDYAMEFQNVISKNNFGATQPYKLSRDSELTD